MSIYLDNAATTRPSEAAIEAAARASREQWGNPSSVYSAGVAAHRALERDRETVRAAIGAGAKEGRVIFTASGTEADNMAIFGTVTAKTHRGTPKILTTDSEHPAVARSMDRLEALGYDVVRIPTVGGAIDMDALAGAADERVILASFMMVNNETGAIYDVAGAARTVRRAAPKALIHTDAVQAFLKCDISPRKTGVDMISVSAHKVHAQKGTGALWVRESLVRSKSIVPYLIGGGQEDAMRSGTQNTAGIAAFAAAVAEAEHSRTACRERAEALHSYALGCLQSVLPEVSINRPAAALPGILSLTLPDIRSETALNFLSARDIFVSAGSACSARSGKASAVLRAFGIGEHEADCTIRVSFDHTNSESDIDALCDALAEGLKCLQRTRR